jgi:hypothetical protein
MADHTKNDPHSGKHEPDSNPSVAHERRDINVFQISAFGIGLALGFIIVVFAMWAMFDYLYKYESAKNVGNPNATMMNQRPQPPLPHLQPEPGEPGPREQLGDMRADEDAVLGSYGWVDQSKGIARIPIDQAIDMIAPKLVAKPTPAGMLDGGYREIPEDSSSGRTLEKIAQ